jgi:inner membrane protein
MSPLTHLLASWLIAAKTTDNPRDCRLVTLAGVLPDADGLGVAMDLANRALGRPETDYYQHYHHYALHGLPGSLLVAGTFVLLARHRLRTGILALLVFHLHLLFDLLGSRGPSPEDLWPIFYFGPFTKDPMWLWRGQWRLDAWPNQVFTWILLLLALWLATRRGDSFVGVFNRRADDIFVRVLRKWRDALTGILFRNQPPRVNSKT